MRTEQQLRNAPASGSSLGSLRRASTALDSNWMASWMISSASSGPSSFACFLTTAHQKGLQKAASERLPGWACVWQHVRVATRVYSYHTTSVSLPVQLLGTEIVDGVCNQPARFQPPDSQNTKQCLKQLSNPARLEVTFPVHACLGELNAKYAMVRRPVRSSLSFFSGTC